MNNSQFSSVYNQPSAEALADIQRGFITRVYAWMTLGLFVTAASALVTISTPGLFRAIVTNQFLFFGLLIGELVLVMVFSGLARRVSPAVAG